MSPDITRVVAKIRNGESAADTWPEALRSLTDALGAAAGAACTITSTKSNRVDWVSERFNSHYVERYARLDAYLPLLNVDLCWIRLSECLPQQLLRRSEWYYDFVPYRA